MYIHDGMTYVQLAIRVLQLNPKNVNHQITGCHEIIRFWNLHKLTKSF